jgi:hypothetical protein
MSVNVYWACTEKEWVRAEKPVSISKRFYDLHKFDPPKKSTPIKCPAIVPELNNLFGLKSLYTYGFEIKNNEVLSSLYDQDFFNNHIIIRDLEKKFFSFTQSYVFFTDSDSLNATIQIPPYFESTELSKNTFCLPGTVDVGKWFRKVDHGFYLKNGVTSFNIDEGDIFYYIKFHTDEKINFKQFIMTEKLNELHNSLTHSAFNRTLKPRKLSEYYATLRYKDKILKEIKENLLKNDQ